MDNFHLIRYVIAGSLHRDFIVTSQEKTYFDIPGGSLPYAASGFALWDTGLGMVGSVGEDFPQDWLDRFRMKDFDVRGLSILAQAIDLRSFIFYLDNQRYESLNPISQFSQLGISIPRTLLGFVPASQRPNELDISIPIYTNQIPSNYLDATAAHICKLDSRQQIMLVSHLQGHVNTISIDPDPSCMKASGWGTIPNLLRGVKILLTSEDKLVNLFKGRSNDIWEMLEELAAYHLEIIVLKRGKLGQYVYDCFSGKRWSLPSYPARFVDATGCGDAFCGGFLAGYRKTYDPLEAALHGNISASFCIEGAGAFYAMDVFPGLAEARLQKLKQMAKKM